MDEQHTEENKPEKSIPETKPLADKQARPGYQNLEKHTQKNHIAERVDVVHDSEEKEETKKKSHTVRTLLIILGIVIVLVVFVIGATGLYVIPGVSNIFSVNQPRDLGVYPSAQALANLEEKVPMEIKSEKRSYTDLSEIFVGTLPFDGKTTDTEITSFLDRFQGDSSIFSETQVKFIEGGMEISTMVDYQIKAPVYLKVLVDQSTSKSINLSIIDGKVGLFTVPDTYLKAAEDFFEDKINSRMAEIDGFSMTKLEYHEGYSDFTGSYPKTVYSNEKGWSGLFTE